MPRAPGPQTASQKVDLITESNALPTAEVHERRGRVVFLAVEAHMRPPDELEEARLLTNAATNSQATRTGC
jgi:hypothetical protein